VLEDGCDVTAAARLADAGNQVVTGLGQAHSVSRIRLAGTCLDDRGSVVIASLQQSFFVVDTGLEAIDAVAVAVLFNVSFQISTRLVQVSGVEVARLGCFGRTIVSRHLLHRAGVVVAGLCEARIDVVVTLLIDRASVVVTGLTEASVLPC